MIRPSAFLLSAAFAAALASPAAADGAKKPVGVVELFTSQGCNSCPPADAVLDRLARRGDLVALSYHVDYWDYLGWKDTLASRANTERQYDYAKSFGAPSVYTPQMVINGRKDVNGADAAAVAGLVEKLGHSGDGLNVDVSATYADERVVVQTGDARGPEKEANVVFVYFDPEKTVKIERGENRDRTITYRNAVLSVQTAGMWNGKAARFEMPESEMTRQGAHGCAVLLQAMGKGGLPGPIIGAAMLEKPAS